VALVVDEADLARLLLCLLLSLGWRNGGRDSIGGLLMVEKRRGHDLGSHGGRAWWSYSSYLAMGVLVVSSRFDRWRWGCTDAGIGDATVSSAVRLKFVCLLRR
jgi:hypothetical protein